MISEIRRELLTAIEALSEDQPDVRLGQLVANLSYLAREPSAEAIWDAEDEEILAAAREILKNRGIVLDAAAKS